MNFLDIFSKNTQISYLMKMRPVGIELFYADGQTDRQTDRHDEANSRFWCMCDRASYMKMTRRTNLMQQLWFIIINNSTCFGHLYVHVQEFFLYIGCLLTHTQCTRLHTCSLGPQPQHLVLNTTCSSKQPVYKKLLKMDI